MSALGQKQTLRWARPMSALPPKADIGTQPCDVRFVPKADIHGLFDHLVGAHQERPVSRPGDHTLLNSPGFNPRALTAASGSSPYASTFSLGAMISAIIACALVGSSSAT